MQRGNSQRRTLLRAVSLIIIVGTIPVYLLLIGRWLFSPQNGRAAEQAAFTPLGEINGGSSGDSGNTDNGGFATFTPINSDFLTEQGQPAFITDTPSFGGTYTYFTPDGGGISFSSPTPPPTRYIPPTAAPTSAATNTLPPTPIIAPTDVILPPTQPPLAPPTDTPTA